MFPKILGIFACVCVWSCPNLCKSMNCIPPGASVHVISQARILEWASISLFRLGFFYGPLKLPVIFLKLKWCTSEEMFVLGFLFCFFPQRELGNMGLSFKNVVFSFQKCWFGICLYIVFIFQKIYFVGGNLPSKEYLGLPNLPNLSLQWYTLAHLDFCLPTLGALWETVLSRDAKSRSGSQRTLRSRDVTRDPAD